METRGISFAEVLRLEEDMAELIIADRSELNPEMVLALQEHLFNRFRTPLRLLVNRKYRFTFTFEGQAAFASMPLVNATAFLVKHPLDVLSSKVMISTPRAKPWCAKHFEERRQALQWLDGFSNKTRQAS